MHVHGEGLPQVAQLLQGLVDEDDADEGGEGLLGEAGDVAHQAAGVRGHQHHAEEGGPEPDARPQGQVGERVFPGKPRQILGERPARASEPRAFLQRKSGAMWRLQVAVEVSMALRLQGVGGEAKCLISIN